MKTVQDELKKPTISTVTPETLKFFLENCNKLYDQFEELDQFLFKKYPKASEDPTVRELYIKILLYHRRLGQVWEHFRHGSELPRENDEDLREEELLRALEAHEENNFGYRDVMLYGLEEGLERSDYRNRTTHK